MIDTGLLYHDGRKLFLDFEDGDVSGGVYIRFDDGTGLAMDEGFLIGINYFSVEKENCADHLVRLFRNIAGETFGIDVRDVGSNLIIDGVDLV